MAKFEISVEYSDDKHVLKNVTQRLECSATTARSLVVDIMTGYTDLLPGQVISIGIRDEDGQVVPLDR